MPMPGVPPPEATVHCGERRRYDCSAASIAAQPGADAAQKKGADAAQKKHTRSDSPCLGSAALEPSAEVGQPREDLTGT